MQRIFTTFLALVMVAMCLLTAGCPAKEEAETNPTKKVYKSGPELTKEQKIEKTLNDPNTPEAVKKGLREQSGK